MKNIGLTIHADKNDYDQLLDVPVWELIRKHKVIVLRGFECLSGENFQIWAKTYGDLLSWEFGSLMELVVDKNAKNYLFTPEAVPFHWDGAFHTEPRLLFFHCLKATQKNSGGETLFSDTEEVYLQLTEEEKKQYQDMKILYETEKKAHYGGCISVPLMQEHPDKKSPIMRFAEPVLPPKLNPVDVKVEGQSDEISKHIVNQLAEKFYQTNVLYEHQWEDNDYLIADNFSLIHGRRAFHGDLSRHIHRVQVL